jgi:hypothetical protein
VPVGTNKKECGEQVRSEIHCLLYRPTYVGVHRYVGSSGETGVRRETGKE